MCFLSWLFGNSNQEPEDELDELILMEMMEEEENDG